MNGFLSYAHSDTGLFNEFTPHLVALKRAYGLAVWTDHQISTGTLWQQSIANAITAAEVFIVLVSTHLIASDYVCFKEIPAIENRRRGGALVLPVVLNPCSWGFLCGNLDAAPKRNGLLVPVVNWKKRHDGFDRARDQMMTSIGQHFGLVAKTSGLGGP